MLRASLPPHLWITVCDIAYGLIGSAVDVEALVAYSQIDSRHDLIACVPSTCLAIAGALFQPVLMIPTAFAGGTTMQAPMPNIDHQRLQFPAASGLRPIDNASFAIGADASRSGVKLPAIKSGIQARQVLRPGFESLDLFPWNATVPAGSAKTAQFPRFYPF